MSAARDFAAPPPVIATRAELDQKRAERSKSDQGLHLVPDGPDAAEVRQQVDVMSKQRETYLEDRLSTLRKGLLRDHSLAQVRGRAVADFERSR